MSRLTAVITCLGFPSSKGLRQGDPLSPYLFVIGMETLSCLLNRATDGNYLSGTKITDGGEGKSWLFPTSSMPTIHSSFARSTMMN